MFILVTEVGRATPQLQNVHDIYQIVEAPNNQRKILFKMAQPAKFVTDTLASILQQQSVSLKRLHLLDVTDDATGNQMLIVAYNLDKIIEEPSDPLKSKVIFGYPEKSIIATQDLATIYAQQGAAGSNNLGFIRVTNKSNTKVYLLNIETIDEVIPIDFANPAAGSTVLFNNKRKSIQVDETVTDIFNDTPQ